jgi:hypothetical protein
MLCLLAEAKKCLFFLKPGKDTKIRGYSEVKTHEVCQILAYSER